MRANSYSIYSLHDEVEFKVLETVTDVNSSEFFRSSLVIELVAWPHKRTSHKCAFFLVKLQGPASLWGVFGNALKEMSVESSSWLIQLLLKHWALHVSEMHIRVKTASFLAGKSLKSFVTANLMLWSHLEGANWCNMAVILNSINNSGKSIQFYS